MTAQELQASLAPHHITDIAAQGNTPFSCPLISEVTDNLWQGGCVQGVNLHGHFQHIVSLYPWERYTPGCNLDSFTEVRLYDGADIPDPFQLRSLARWINLCRQHGRVLVHCQAGLNRSGLLTAYALILDGMEPAKAIKLLRDARSPAVLCNRTFEQWLLSRWRN